MSAIFEIHLEDWNHALHIEGRDHKSSVSWLLNILEKNGITPEIYVLDDWALENPEFYSGIGFKYKTKSHGKHHYYDEKADRSPYWNREGIPGMCGGFFFRLLPLWFVKKEIERTGIFYIHPHDLDENHPKVKNPWLNWKRHVGIKGARRKLERLLSEVKFAKPS